MNIMVVDDEPAALSLMKKAIQKAAPGEVPACFSNVRDAYTYAEEQPVDVAFLDIEMGDVSGLELAKLLVKMKPDINIIFVTGYARYMGEAFRLYASGYVRKPPRVSRIGKELANLRHNPETAPKLPEQIGEFTFDHNANRVLREGKDISLKPMEYKILLALAAKPGNFLTARELYRKASGLDAGEDIRALYVHISGLRKKLYLHDAGRRQCIDIEQERGKGYRIVII